MSGWEVPKQKKVVQRYEQRKKFRDDACVYISHVTPDKI